jgi:type IV pilus assembly protein PilB
MGSTAQRTLRVGDVLLERGLVTAAQLEEAAGVQQRGGKRQLLGEVLIELGYLTPAQLCEALADANGLPFVKLTPKFVDPAVLTALSRDVITARDVLPLFNVDGVLTVAMTEPSNVFLIEEITQLVGSPVQFVAVLQEDLHATRDKLAREGDTDVESLYQEATASKAAPTSDGRAEMDELGSNSPVVQLVNHAIQNAIRDGASDIHFEPDEEVFRVRYRIDGHLVERFHPPVQMQAAIVSRIKILAGMDISERRLPQDGAIRVSARGKPVDLRVSTLPNKYGEKVVLRILDNSSALLTFDGLDLATSVRETFERLCRQPFGIILVTGPTGSGKSTTLYSMLSYINSPNINICTVEDPIEFNVKGINQFQVHSKIDLTFASVLRTLLRQDPDVIMVGEIRDPETGGIAVQAALTGHLVLSTLHTNDAAGAITRLQNLGVEPYLLSAALVGIAAQRLVRRVCRECLTWEAPNHSTLAAAERVGVKLEKVARGRGCSACHRTGFRGRTGIYEILAPDDEMRDAIASGANLGALRKLARAQGMKSLFDYGMDKVRAGDTSLEELLRVTSV